jgi:hypothetical protein
VEDVLPVLLFGGLGGGVDVREVGGAQVALFVFGGGVAGLGLAPGFVGGVDGSEGEVGWGGFGVGLGAGALGFGWRLGCCADSR